MTDLIRQYRAVKATVEKTSGSILIYSGASDIAEE